MPDDELVSRIIAVIAKTQHIDAATITVEKTFQELNIDSLDGINILFALESEFDINIPDEGAQGLKTIGQMVDGVIELIRKKEQSVGEAR